MIRLRQSIEARLQHPVLGPVLLLLLALLLVFVIFHTVEHGVEGVLFSCVVLVALALRLVVVLGRTWRAGDEELHVRGRAPPRQATRFVPPSRVPPACLPLPLRL